MTWEFSHGHDVVTVDFLIQSRDNPQGVSPPKLTQIERDFAALTIDGLEFAFMARQRVEIRGATPNGATLRRGVWVCGPAPFIILKSLAHANRAEPKDAYDLFYVLRELGLGRVAGDFAQLPRDNPTIERALTLLRRDFIEESLGRAHVAEFMTGSRDDDIEADVFAFVSGFLARLDNPGT